MVRVILSTCVAAAMLPTLAIAPAAAKPKEIVVVGSKIKETTSSQQRSNRTRFHCRFCTKAQQAS